MSSVEQAMQQAQMALQSGNWPIAAEHARRGMAAVGESPTLLAVLCVACRGMGQFQEAVAAGQRATELAPNSPDVHNALGAAWEACGQFARAADSFHRAAQLQPNPTYWANLGLALFRLERFELAAAAFQQAITLGPPNDQLYYNLGGELTKLGRYAAAADSYRLALAIRPSYDAGVNLANSLIKLQQFDDAERELRRAIAMEPERFEAHISLGTILHLNGRLPEALSTFDEALRVRPDSALAHQYRAFVNLTLGNYLEGWDEWEWRWKLGGTIQPNFTQPRWEGEPLDEKTLLLVFEQGIGDSIQFVRYAGLIKARHPTARVLLQCPAAWRALLETTPGLDGIVPAEFTYSAFDYYVPLFSLPRLLGTTFDNIPARPSYLSPQTERVWNWGRQLLEARRLRVGIAWQGNPEYAADEYRSIPLVYFAPLALLNGIHLFSLQKNFGQEQLRALPPQIPIVDLGAVLDTGTDTFVDTAAVMRNLDLVITSDTSMAHLAGALGVPVWLVLQLCPNWRWSVGCDDCPWYPSMRLFRQTRLGDWEGVFSRIARELTSLVAARRGS